MYVKGTKFIVNSDINNWTSNLKLAAPRKLPVDTGRRIATRDSSGVGCHVLQTVKLRAGHAHNFRMAVEITALPY